MGQLNIFIFKRLGILIGLMLVVAVPLAAQSGDCWGNFRGDAKLTGVSKASIPDKPGLLWSFNAQASIMAAPVTCNGVIVVGTSKGHLFGINTDGTLKWKIETGNSIEAPALILGNMVYAGNLSGMLYAVDLESGNIKWTYRTDNQIMGSPASYSKGKKQVILVGSYDYYLHAVDPLTGAGLWKFETDNFINGSCALFNGMAVFGGCDGYLHLVDALTGKSVASMEISTYVASSPCIDGNFAYVGDYDGLFSAVDLVKEKIGWVFENKDAYQPFMASPAIEGDRVYIGNRDKYVYCLNKNDGKLVWKYNTGGAVDASPVVIGNRLLVGNTRGDLFLIDTQSGNPVWSYELGTAINANPAVVENRIYVAAQDGRVYCFGKK